MCYKFNVDCFRSHNGRLLVIASTDGYCTIVTFEDGELGEAYKKQVHEMFSVDQPTNSSTGNEQTLGKDKVPSPIRESASTKDASGRISQLSDESKAKTASVSAVVASESSITSLETLSLAASSTAETSSFTTAQGSSASSSSMDALSSMPTDSKPPRRVAVTTLVSASLCSDRKAQPSENQPRRITTTTVMDGNTAPVVDKPSEKDLISEQVQASNLRKLLSFHIL